MQFTKCGFSNKKFLINGLVASVLYEVAIHVKKQTNKKKKLSPGWCGSLG